MKPEYYSRAFMMLLIVIMLMQCTQTITNSNKNESLTKNLDEVILKQDPEGIILSEDLTLQSYYDALEVYDVKFKKEVLAQAILETGYFKSYNCKVKNNTLGLFNSRKMEFFSFDHWAESIKGYKNMIEYRMKEDEDYYDFLLRIGYAEDPDYIPKVKRIVSLLDENENNVITYNI